MSKIQLVGRVKGTFDGYDYFQLIFIEAINEKQGDGFKPYIARNSKGNYSCFVGCTKEVFEKIKLDDVYDTSNFLFNSKMKLAGY